MSERIPYAVSLVGPDIEIHPIIGLNRASLIHDAEGWKFRHRCDRGERGVIDCAPRLVEGGHRVTVSNGTPPRITVTPSILCDDCGTHGFVTDGRWS